MAELGPGQVITRIATCAERIGRRLVAFEAELVGKIFANRSVWAGQADGQSLR